MIQVKEFKGHQLLNIRNPWGTFEWEGDWHDNDRLWTPEIISALNPVFGDDGTFWMCFQDFVNHFSALNVCKVNDWEEVRVKGEFTNFSQDPNLTGSDLQSTVRSRYFYELTVPDSERS